MSKCCTHAVRSAATWLVVTAAVSCSAYNPDLLESEVRLAPATRADAGPDASQPVAGQGPDDPPQPLTRCGDGLITGEEKCDLGIQAGRPGACPGECPPLAACARRALNNAGTCQAECIVLALVCEGGDGCCPSSCAADNDSDCSPSCGDGIVQAEAGETCEPESKRPCFSGDSACSDDNACTRDLLIGSAANCNTACTNEPLSANLEAADGCCPPGADSNTDADCAPRCGNGVKEGAEACDGTTGCDELCALTLQPKQLACLEKFSADACQRCSCMNCADSFLACQDSGDSADDASCGAVLACAREENCVGTPCYCGDPPICGVPPGPCVREIERAAGSTDPLAVDAAARDPESPLGRAWTADRCRVDQCRDVCRPTAR